MLQLKEKFKLFLESNNFLPLSKWSSFQLDHGKPTIYKKNCIKIKREVADKSGLYIYQKDGQVLYIGKGNPLINRLKDHNRKSFEPTPRDTKNKMWYKFFSKNKGKVKIYWKEIGSEEERVILEEMLEYVRPSKFMAYKNNILLVTNKIKQK